MCLINFTTSFSLSLSLPLPLSHSISPYLSLSSFFPLHVFIILEYSITEYGIHVTKYISWTHLVLMPRNPFAFLAGRTFLMPNCYSTSSVTILHAPESGSFTAVVMRDSQTITNNKIISKQMYSIGFSCQDYCGNLKFLLYFNPTPYSVCPTRPLSSPFIVALICDRYKCCLHTMKEKPWRGRDGWLINYLGQGFHWSFVKNKPLIHYINLKFFKSLLSQGFFVIFNNWLIDLSQKFSLWLLGSSQTWFIFTLTKIIRSALRT